MTLARECIKSYPKKPSEKEIRFATEKERITMLADIFARHKEVIRKDREAVNRKQMDIE